MPLDIFHRNDIRNAIRSLAQSGMTTAEVTKRLFDEYDGDMRDLEKKIELYQSGYYAALGAMALAFGIPERSF